MLSATSFAAALCAMLLFMHFSPVSAAPVAQNWDATSPVATSYWLADTKRHLNLPVWQGSNEYKVYRNVKDSSYGALGDGVHDDTEAINKAISDGNRCGGGDAGFCDSSTVSPALVYFPPGTYLVKKPIIQWYYTQMVGDAINPPTILADPTFQGIAVIDSDPYNKTGGNWFTNQNNFFRQVRNFVIDLTHMPETAGAGIHWQVAQATSLQNIVFNMKPASASNKQQGIFMDNGSGGYIGNLTFNGGNYGAFLGNQQFTSRDLTFNGCNTAIFMNWNWGWTFSDVKINNCGVGLDMANSPTNQTVGSVILSDSTIRNTPIGVNTAWQQSNNVPESGDTLILDNVDMTTVTTAVQYTNGQSTEPLLAGGKTIASWASGNGYSYNGTSPLSSSRSAGPITAPNKSPSLLSGGKIYGRTKPQYQDVDTKAFVSAKGFGLVGDGVADDTVKMQDFLNSIGTGQIAYFDHGAYVVTDTIKVPNNIIITGEIWPLIVATGSNFQNASNPRPVWQVGQPGNITLGAVEISDMIFETKNSTAGAVMIEWNLNSAQGASGIWDSHVRIGGSAGTGLDTNSGCTKPSQVPTKDQTDPKNPCIGVFLMFHATQAAGGVYLENTWFWVADHDLDNNQPTQISIYSGRGVLIEANGPVWMWGTASEHSIIYNYQFNNAQAVFSGFMQSETPYFQPDPQVPNPLAYSTSYADPTFTICNATSSATCHDAWGLRVLSSKNILIYGAGMYSFFQNYDQTCVPGQNCQENMIRIQGSQVDMYAVSTKAAVNMIQDENVGVVKDVDNRSNFCATIAYYFTSA